MQGHRQQYSLKKRGKAHGISKARSIPVVFSENSVHRRLRAAYTSAAIFSASRDHLSALLEELWIRLRVV